MTSLKKKKIFSVVILIIMTFQFSFAIQTYADTSPNVVRLGGIDKYATAAAIANSGWKQSDYAILAYGENYPDALSAAPLASKYDAPILLTKSNSLPEVTKQALINLQVKKIFIIGGTGVIANSIESELESMGIKENNLNRIAGKDRYETAILVARQIANYGQLFVVIGEDYPDALSIAPIAALKQYPIILVPKDVVPDCVKDYVNYIGNSRSGTSPLNTYVVGDSSVINDDVFKEFIGFKPERIVGEDKYERNIAINQKFNIYLNSDSLCLATGENFADALAGSVYAAKLHAPIILVKNSSQDITKSYYQERLNNTNTINVFGGTAVVSDSLIQDLGNKSLSKPQTICKFKDHNLENVVRATIHKNNGDITIQDAQSLKCIYGNDSQIKDLSGIENCTNLTALYLENNQITDISALKGLSNLRTLHLEGNQLNNNQLNNSNNDFDDLKYICIGNLNLRDLTGGDYNCSQIMSSRNFGKDLILIDNISISVNQNDSYILPSTVKAKVYKGITGSDVAVKWNTPTVDTSEVGTYYYYGMVDGYDGYVILTVKVTGNAQ
jgi:putative cell wall-binding protein